METIQNDKFEQIKLQAINCINTESVFLKPACIVNTLFKAHEEPEEESKEEEEVDKQTELYRGLTDLMGRKPAEVRALRKDVDEVARKALKEAEDEDSFSFASSITVMEAKPKRKKRR